MKEEENRKKTMEAVGEETSGATPFDDAFKTEVVRLKELLIPLINELYGTDYEISLVDVGRMQNEHYELTGISDDKAAVPHKLTDSCLKIDGKLYHVECQSTIDGNILLRLVEYNMQIGIENAYSDRDTGALVVELPRSSLLMLRAGKNGGSRKSTREIVYLHEGQEIRMEIPVLNVQAYTGDDIYDKKLYFLIPFYAMRYEDRFRDIAKNADQNSLDVEDECGTIYSELKNWFGRLKEAYESSKITEDEGRNLAELSRMILNHITRKLPHDIAERLVSTVGGKVLELQQDRWFADGFKKGETAGEKRGIKVGEERGIKVGEERMRSLFALIPQGSEDYELALKASETDIQKLYEKYGV